MAAIVSLGEDAYGVTIHRAAEVLMQPRKCQLGAVYATLDRIEDKGLAESWMSAPTAERGGRARRHYKLSPMGEEALGDAAAVARRICRVLDDHWGGQGLSPA